MEKIFDYAPLILAITVFFINFRIFVTPADLEKKHRAIKEEIKQKAYRKNGTLLLFYTVTSTSLAPTYCARASGFMPSIAPLTPALT